MRADQFDASLGRLFVQRGAIDASVGNQPAGLLEGTTGAMPTLYADLCQRRLDQLDLRPGRRVNQIRTV
jgi:hypothetical protein